jgi:hypothetical protein
MDHHFRHLVWGAYQRMLGLVYFFAYTSLLKQVIPLVGSHGISPFAPRLQQMLSDFSVYDDADGWHGIYRVPLRWIYRMTYCPCWFLMTGCTDRLLRFFVIAG